MADTVTSIVLADTPYHYGVHLTCVSDGTGESAVVKVDKSAIKKAAGGSEAAALDIESVRWAIQGFSAVKLLWDHTADDTAMVLAGSGYDEFPRPTLDQALSACLKDPGSAGGAGDVLLTSTGAASGATYDITLWLRKRVA